MEATGDMTSQEERERSHPVELPPELKSAPRIEPPVPAEPMLAQSPPTELGAAHSEFASFHEGYVRHYIALADTKAGVIFTLTAGIIGFLLGNDDVRESIIAPAGWIARVITVSAMVSLVAVTIFAFLVIAPRLSAPSGEGLVSFGAVSQKPSALDYVREVGGSSEADLTVARLGHCYDISKICSRKYALLKRAIWMAPLSLLLSLITVLMK